MKRSRFEGFRPRDATGDVWATPLAGAPAAPLACWVTESVQRNQDLSPLVAEARWASGSVRKQHLPRAIRQNAPSLSRSVGPTGVSSICGATPNSCSKSNKS